MPEYTVYIHRDQEEDIPFFIIKDCPNDESADLMAIQIMHSIIANILPNPEYWAFKLFMDYILNSKISKLLDIKVSVTENSIGVLYICGKSITTPPKIHSVMATGIGLNAIDVDANRQIIQLINGYSDPLYQNKDNWFRIKIVEIAFGGRSVTSVCYHYGIPLNLLIPQELLEVNENI